MAGQTQPGPASGGAGAGRGRERGAGTVLALGLGLLLIVAASGIALLGQAFATAARAASAADLAALAAADAERGLRPGPACAVAERVASLNGAAVGSCTVEVPGSTVRVVVHIDAGAPWGPATGRARAGPPP